MNLKALLNPLTQVLLVSALLPACVERDCTDEEREEAGADGNDDCTRFVPLEVFDDSEMRSNVETWESGQDVLVTGDLREITVVRGSEGEVEFEWHAQAALAQGREQEVIDRTMEHLSASSSTSASTISFEADRGSSEADLGAALVVKLPPDFDARLQIDKRKERGGDVAIEFLGEATELEVDMNDLGEDLTIADAASLRRVLVNTNGDIEMTSAFGEVLEAAALHSLFGDIVARFAGAPSSHARVITDFGDVSVEIGASANFTLSAEADTVTFNSLPSTCSTREDTETNRSLLCNDGDPDGLTFEVVASGEVTVRM